MKPHPLLFPFSIVYGVAVFVRNMFFKIGLKHATDVGVPVISIGNITAGGSGKTPLVMNVVNTLMKNGKKVAVVSRGYGRNSKGTIVVSDGSKIYTNANESGDEPVQIAQSTKTIVIVDEDRVRGAKKAIDDFGAEVIVLDDGFQHRAIHRTKDIVLIDAQHPPYSMMLLPAGYRRESVHSLRRADAVMATKCNSSHDARAIIDDRRIGSVKQRFSSSYSPSGIRNLNGQIPQSISMVNNRTAIAFCGIATPESFRNSLTSCGVIMNQFFEFADHYRYTHGDIQSIIQAYHDTKADFILTTEKDAVRLMEFGPMVEKLPIFSLTMEVSIHQKDAWERYLLS